MVDNENQWEDMEYSDDETGDFDEEYSSENDDVIDDEYSEQDYEDYDEEGYDEDEGEVPPQRKGGAGGCIILLLLLLLLIGAAVFFFFGKKNENVQPQEQSVGVENSQMQQPSDNGNNSNDTTALGDAFFSEAGGSDMMAVDFGGSSEVPLDASNGNDEIVAAVNQSPQDEQPQEQISEQPQENENVQGEETNIEDLFPQSGGEAVTEEDSEIMVSYNRKARLNPFKPPVLEGKVQDYDTVGDAGFEIIEPPTDSVADENLTRLLQTTISGILYDEVSPSAIVNLNGIDQFVKIGDVIAGYTIDSITKDKVQITYKNNTYVASVGELFTRGLLERQQAVADLENKFAGRYRNE